MIYGHEDKTVIYQEIHPTFPFYQYIWWNYYWHGSAQEEQYLHRSVPECWTWQRSRINKSSIRLTVTWDKNAMGSHETPRNIWLAKTRTFGRLSARLKQRSLLCLLPLQPVQPYHRGGLRSGRPDPHWKPLSVDYLCLKHFSVEIIPVEPPIFGELAPELSVGAAALHAVPLRHLRSIFRKQRKK